MAITYEQAKDLMKRSMTTGVPTSEFNAAGGYDAVKAVFDAGGGTYSYQDIEPEKMAEYQAKVASTGTGNKAILDPNNVPQYSSSAAPASSSIDPAALLAEAASALRKAMSYKPEKVTGQGYTAQTIADQDLSQYMNPYTQEVIDQSMADLERLRQMQMNNLGFSATQAGAFGGSRHGVAESLTNEAFVDQGARMASNLRNQGFAQALQSAGFDVGSMNQAAQFGAGATNAANLANQTAGLQGAQLNLNAATQMGNLSNLGFNQMNTLNTNAFNQGLAQQQMNQNLINNAMQQYQAWQGYPQTSLGFLNAGLGGINAGSTSTTGRNYSGADVIGSINYAFPSLFNSIF